MGRTFEANDMAVLWWLRDHCAGWPARTKLAYIMLYARMGPDLWVWPSKGTLASDMSMGKDAAISALKDLDRMRLFEEKQYCYNRETGAQESTRYKLKGPWEANYTACPEYAPKITPSDKPTGGVDLNDRGVSVEPTGSVGLSIGRESDKTTGPCRIDRHKAEHMKLTISSSPEEEVTPVGPLLSNSESAETWQHWWQRRSGAFPSATHEAEFADLKCAGVTDELIIAVGEKTLADKLAKHGHPLKYVHGFVAGLSAQGIRTRESWVSELRRPASTPQTIPATGTVLLNRRPKSTDEIDGYLGPRPPDPDHIE